MTSSADRDVLASSFDRAAHIYQRARPDYPEELFDDLIDHAGLRRGDRLLEIGCATGTATLPLARRGFRITCLEPGASLASEVRAASSDLTVEVIETRFEDWSAGPTSFDLVFAATAWQWLDPHTKYVKARDALRPGGHLAFWDASHVFPDGGDPFFREIQEVYEEVGEGLPSPAVWPRPGELPDRRREIEGSGAFEVVYVRQFDWERIYDAGSYIELLETFSGHILMESWKRERLFGEIRARLARRPDGTVRRHWGCVLHVARSFDDAGD